jgi:hypothetical protein
MQFTSRDLTNQYISRSYQDVLQQYLQSDFLYILDGLGNVVGNIPSASIGNILITSDVTASMTVASASVSTIIQIYQESSSFASSSISSSYAPFTQIYQESASWASQSLSASWAPMPVIPSTDSASWASSSLSSSISHTASLAYASLTSDYSLDSLYSVTASYAMNAGGGGGTTLYTASTYSITSSWSQNSLTASYIAIMPSGSTESASYALTASYALNGGGSSGLVIPSYDYSNLTYNGPLGQVSDCTYKVGGSGGTTVCIVTALYSGDIFIGVSKSLG